MFDFFNNYIVVACDNYFRIFINVSLKQQLCCNYIYVIMKCVQISTTHYTIHLQLVSIMIPIDIISMAINAPLLKYYCSTIL